MKVAFTCIYVSYVLMFVIFSNKISCVMVFACVKDKRMRATRRHPTDTPRVMVKHVTCDIIVN